LDPGTFHQRTLVSLEAETVEAGADDVVTRPLLTEGSNRVPHLWGYRFWSGFDQDSGPAGQNEGHGVGMLLRASGEDLLSTNFRFLLQKAVGASNPLLERHIVDFYHWEHKVVLNSAVGFIHAEASNVSPWTPCDLVLPALYVSFAFRNDDSASVGLFGAILVDYTWEDVTPGELAAVNFAWGRDSKDYVQGDRLITA